MATSNATPKQFDILTFAGARERELRGLVELLRAQDGAASGGSEPSASRHVRRRTASHSSRRHNRRPNTKLEARRKAAKEAGDDAQMRTLMNRAMRRRRGLLLQQASSSCDWRMSDLEDKADTHHSEFDAAIKSPKRKLETHLWHAKRMRMSSYWGWMLPAGAAGEGRGWRVMRRTLESQTSFYGHDLSYWAPLLLSVDGSTSDDGEVKSSLEDITKRLCLISCPEDATRVHSLLSTGREVVVTLSVPTQVIGPVLLTRLPGQKSIICWVHTAAVSASAIALRSAGLNMSPLPLRRLELVGTNCTRAALGLPDESSSFDWTKLAPSGLVPDGAVALVRCLDPRLRSKDSDTLLAPTISNGNNPTDDDSLAHLLLRVHPAPLSDGDVATRRRERRVHEAAVPWEDAGGMDSLNALDDGNASLTKSTAATISQSYVMGLVMHKKKKQTKTLAGMSLILPREWARIVWMDLAFQGMRPTGQEEWRELMTRQEKLFFPHDYPQSQAYIQQAREEAEFCKQRAERRPANKPMAIGSCLPSPEDWKALAESGSRDQASTEGKVVAGEASPIDIVRVRVTLQGKGPALVPGANILMMTGQQTPSNDKNDPTITIGYVTSAARHARITTAAFCLASISDRKARFLVRNPGASKAHSVRIERLMQGPIFTAE